ncbi:MAG: hypothetical protein M3072_12525 [Candidatus Dormibacteraeota bacterium]|nr:hypothetical protein [Candidatus Dormibacteraeota bacterium]
MPGCVPVIGLVAGWGTVAIHRQEGFRAQHATLLCLFSDSVWAQKLNPLERQRTRWWWTRSWMFPGSGVLASRPSNSLRRVASGYGVPLVQLGDAIRSGLLAEFGVPRHQIEAAEALLDAS